jgi:hypothetical protein
MSVVGPGTAPPPVPTQVPEGATFTSGPYNNPTQPPTPANLQQWSPTPSVPPVTNAMQNYMQQYNQSWANQQQALNAALLSATQGLNQRRDAAAAVAAQVPGQFQNAYQTAMGNYATGRVAGPNLVPPGTPPAKKGAPAPTSMIGATPELQQEVNANNNINTNFIKANLAAGAMTAPLLKAGIAADYTQGQNALANTNLANQADLNSQKMNFALQMAQDQANNQARLQQAQTQQQASQQAAIDKQQNSIAVRHGFGDFNDLQQTMNSPEIKDLAAQYQRALNVQNGGNARWDVQGHDKNSKEFKDAYQKLQDGLKADERSGWALWASGVMTSADYKALYGKFPTR